MAGRRSSERSVDIVLAIVALVGVTLYRALFGTGVRRAVRVGLQEERLAGAPVFVLPNPSGRNAHFRHDDMLEAFKALASWLVARSS